MKRALVCLCNFLPYFTFKIVRKIKRVKISYAGKIQKLNFRSQGLEVVQGVKESLRRDLSKGFELSDDEVSVDNDIYLTSTYIYICLRISFIGQGSPDIGLTVPHHVLLSVTR